jgi:hypothetical protein
MPEDWLGSRGGATPPPRGTVQLTVLLTSEEVEDLERQARADKIAVTDVIRRSLALGRIAWEAQRRKARLVVQERDGQLRPVELPTAPTVA